MGDNFSNQSHKVKSPFKAYDGDGQYIFVSYKHKDADIVYPLIKQFHDRGFNIWYDEGLPYGENFDIVIPKKIQGATLFVNFITHECMACANDSEDYMIKESDIAQHLKVPILAIYPQPNVELEGYYLTNFLKKQSVYKPEYDSDEEKFIDLCVDIFKNKGLNPNPMKEFENPSMVKELEYSDKQGTIKKVSGEVPKKDKLSLDFSFVSSKIKTIVGIISFFMGMAVLFITPSYIEFYLIIPFLIFAIFLIIPKDSIQNNKIVGVLLIIVAAIVIYLSVNGILNTYDVLTNLYLEGKFTTLPTASDISACSTGYGIVLAYAILNIIFGGLFFIPTSGDPY